MCETFFKLRGPVSGTQAGKRAYKQGRPSKAGQAGKHASRQTGRPGRPDKQVGQGWDGMGSDGVVLGGGKGLWWGGMIFTRDYPERSAQTTKVLERAPLMYEFKFAT